MPLCKLRPHMSSIHTLAWEVPADRVPSVSFVHNFLGSVETNLYKNAEGAIDWVLSTVKNVVGGLFGRWLFVPIEECGEREVYLATSGRYEPRVGSARGVVRGDVGIAEGSDGREGSGVYSVTCDGEKRTETSVEVLRDLRAQGVKEMVWEHMNAEFDRITAAVE
ncbi:hypothetical protein HBI43_150320 [Parastagonospora nodorum]|nr:hypothetical protein HBI43_150320 [Parastagonospora nodorum]